MKSIICSNIKTFFKILIAFTTISLFSSKSTKLSISRNENKIRSNQQSPTKSITDQLVSTKLSKEKIKKLKKNSGKN